MWDIRQTAINGHPNQPRMLSCTAPPEEGVGHCLLQHRGAFAVLRLHKSWGKCAAKLLHPPRETAFPPSAVELHHPALSVIFPQLCPLPWLACPQLSGRMPLPAPLLCISVEHTHRKPRVSVGWPRHVNSTRFHQSRSHQLRLHLLRSHASMPGAKYVFRRHRHARAG